MAFERMAQRHAAVEACKALKGDVVAAARHIGKPVRFVKRWFDAYKETGDVLDKPRCGRPQLLSKDGKRKARILATTRKKSSCRKIADKLKSSGVTKTAVSRWTVSRYLKQGRKKMLYRDPSKQKEFPARVKAARLRFCRKHRDRSWRDILVLDSKYFQIGSKGSAKEWHYAGVCKKAPAIRDKTKIHAYGAACIHGCVPLRFVSGTTGLKNRFKGAKGENLTGVGYKEFIQVLNFDIIPGARKLFKGKRFTILMDKAPAHKPLAVRRFLAEHGIDIISDWPGNSPDFNWIEDLWGIMEQNLKGRSFRSQKALEVAVKREWESIHKSNLGVYASSMRRRVRKCIQLQGGHTGY
jgi:transposase